MRTAIVTLLLVALAAVGASARPGPAVNVNEWAHDVVDVLKEWSHDRLEVDASALNAVQHAHDDDKDYKFTLLVKYIVRPSIAKEFSKEWLKVRDEAKEAKGNLRFSLSKPLTDNILYYSYQEWESKADFFKYIMEEGSEVKKLAEYIEEKDIALTLTQLIPIAFHKEHHHGHGTVQLRNAQKMASQPMRVMADLLGDASDSLQAWMEPAATSTLKHGGRDPHDTIILSKLIVKPSEVKEFVKAAELITKEVGENEEGSVVYGFSKTLTDDVTFYNYAVWEGKEAIEEHLKSSYARKFRDFVLENDILLTTTVLFPIESLDE